MIRFLVLSVVALGLVGGLFAKQVNAGGGGKEVRVEGTIVGIDLTAKSVVIRKQSGEQVTVQTTASTKIERNGVHATLAAFKLGDRGQARFRSGACYKLEAVGP